MAETAEQRIDRITREILSGQRSFDDLRQSLDRLAGGTVFQPYGSALAGDEAARQAGYDAVRARVEASFRNRNVAFDQYQPVGSNLNAIRNPPPTTSGRYPGTISNPRLREAAQRNLNRSEQQQDTGNTIEQQDALSQIRSLLGQYGFTPAEVDELAGMAWNLITQRHSVGYVLTQLEQTQTFKNQFPEIELRRKNGLPPLAPGEIVAYRGAARQLFQRYGLPQGFYDDKGDFTDFLAKDISLAELNSRVVEGFVAAQQAPKEVRDMLRDFYGVNEGGLAAFFLDPNKAEPVLKKQFAAARIGGTAITTGYGRLGRDTAEGLTSRIESMEEAEQGFGTLARSKELFSPITGHQFGEDTIGQESQFRAAFDDSAEDQERIRRRARRRQSGFESGGAFSAGRSGFEGIGEAD